MYSTHCIMKATVSFL